MISFLQNKRLNQLMILLICMFPIVVAAQGIEEALLNTKNTVEEKKEELEAAKDLPFQVENLEKSDAFKDTTKMFETPNNANKVIKSFLSDEEIKNLALEIQNV